MKRLNSEYKNSYMNYLSTLTNEELDNELEYTENVAFLSEGNCSRLAYFHVDLIKEYISITEVAYN